MEMRDHLNVAADETFATENQMASLRRDLEAALESLNGYIACLERCGGK